MSTLVDRPAVGSGEIRTDAGLPGYAHARSFQLERWGPEGSPYQLLRSLDIEGLKFVVMPPVVFFPEYNFELDDPVSERLGITSADDVTVLVILTLGATPQETTANLLGPLIVNHRTGCAAQIVLSGSGWSTQQLLVG